MKRFMVNPKGMEGSGCVFDARSVIDTFELSSAEIEELMELPLGRSMEVDGQDSYGQDSYIVTRLSDVTRVFLPPVYCKADGKPVPALECGAYSSDDGASYPDAVVQKDGDGCALFVKVFLYDNCDMDRVMAAVSEAVNDHIMARNARNGGKK